MKITTVSIGCAMNAIVRTENRFALHPCCPPAGLKIRQMMPEAEKVARIFRYPGVGIL